MRHSGASIIRMMRHFLTEATFKAGLTNYLRDRYVHIMNITKKYNSIILLRIERIYD